MQFVFDRNFVPTNITVKHCVLPFILHSVWEINKDILFHIPGTRSHLC